MERVTQWIHESRNVVVLVGAGISTAAGIPDFRSPGGMYDTLRPELLTANEYEKRAMRDDPTEVVSWSLFQHNQFPYLEVRRPFILGINNGKWKPTFGHMFFKQVENVGKLRRVYSQNIDGLFYQTGINANKIVPCHGSLGVCACEFCGKEGSMERFVHQVSKNIRDIYNIDDTAPSHSTNIKCTYCGENGMKPNTVLYGRALPEQFFLAQNVDFPAKTDLLFIIGTSLTVSPANQLPMMCSRNCKRVVINATSVGEDMGLGGEENDELLMGDCDEILRELSKALGWYDIIESSVQK